MPKFLTEEDINGIKGNQAQRNKIRAELEELVEIGKPRIHSVESNETWNRMTHRVATEDAIILFCNDLGNYNPLYRSQDLALKSIYGSLIAPPHFLTVISPFTQSSYKELFKSEYVFEAIDGGIDVEWFKLIRENDEFTVIEIPTEVRDVTRVNTGLRFMLYAKKIYRNQREETVTIVKTSAMMIPIIKHGNLQQVVDKRKPTERYFSEKDVDEWWHEMLKEPIRGSSLRFWEDVNTGEQIPPYRQVYSSIEYEYLSRGGGYPGTGSWRVQMDRSSANRYGWKTVLDSESGLPNFASIHLLDSAAQWYGLPRAVAAGAQMTCWLSNMITNWMGDTGFLKKISHQYRRFLWRESFALCKGQVIKKYVEGDAHLVDIKYTLEDHNGDFQIPSGVATMILPTRQNEHETYDKKREMTILL